MALFFGDFRAAPVGALGFWRSAPSSPPLRSSRRRILPIQQQSSYGPLAPPVAEGPKLKQPKSGKLPMHEAKASQTAQIIALMRAIGQLSPQVPGFHDPLAARFLVPPYSNLLKAIQAGGLYARLRSRFEVLGGMAVFNQFRTVVLDAAIAQAPAFTQLVILGAGYDSRAWRLPNLAHATVFEVDHPSTQATKRRQIGELHPLSRALHYVPVDFAADDLDACLERAGHDPQQPTFWLWEGVVMYLDQESVAATMQAALKRSIQGSSLALTYMNQHHNPLKALTTGFLAMLGEPHKVSFTADDLKAFAATCGWQALSDTGIKDWRQTLAPALRLSSVSVGPQWHERIWVGAAQAASARLPLNKVG